ERRGNKEPQTLGRKRKPFGDDDVSRLPRDRFAAPFDRSAARLHQARNGVERRGLARAVRAEQRDDGAFLDSQRDVSDADEIAVVHLKMRNSQLVHGASLRRRWPRPRSASSRAWFATISRGLPWAIT